MDERTPIPYPFNEASSNVLREDEQEALDYYLHGGSRRDDMEYKGKERRSSNNPLGRNLAMLRIKLKSNGASDEEKLINFFQESAPMSKQEGMTLMLSATRRLKNAENTHTGAGEAAVIERYGVFLGYFIDAAEDVHTLNRAIRSEKEGVSKPDIGIVRTSHDVLKVISKQLETREFLWNKYWPSTHTNTYKDRHKYWWGFTLAAARSASDGSMVQLFEFAKKRSDKRLSDWIDQVVRMEELPVIRRLIKEDKIVPIPFNKLRGAHIHEEKTALEPDAAAGEPTSFDKYIPKDVRPEVERLKQNERTRVAIINMEADQAWEELERSMRNNTEQIRNELKNRSLGWVALSDEIPNKSYDDELAGISNRARSLGSRPSKEPSKRKRPRITAWMRRQTGYDHERDPSNPQLF